MLMNLQEICDNLKPPFYSKYSQYTGNVQDKIVSILKLRASGEKQQHCQIQKTKQIVRR